MYSNKIYKYIKIMIIMLIVFLFFVISLLIYKDKKLYTELKENMYITSLYGVIWQYHIWERTISWWMWEEDYKHNSICSYKTKACLSWNLKGIKIDSTHTYIYVSPNTYKWDYYISANDIENIKPFWIFTQDSMNFYSISELEKLPEEQREILLDLKENPRFIFE